MSSKEENRKVPNKTPEKSPRRPKQGEFFVIVNETFVGLPTEWELENYRKKHTEIKELYSFKTITSSSASAESTPLEGNIEKHSKK